MLIMNRAIGQGDRGQSHRTGEDGNIREGAALYKQKRSTGRYLDELRHQYQRCHFLRPDSRCFWNGTYVHSELMLWSADLDVVLYAVKLSHFISACIRFSSFTTSRAGSQMSLLCQLVKFGGKWLQTSTYSSADPLEAIYKANLRSSTSGVIMLGCTDIWLGRSKYSFVLSTQIFSTVVGCRDIRFLESYIRIRRKNVRSHVLSAISYQHAKHPFLT